MFDNLKRSWNPKESPMSYSQHLSHMSHQRVAQVASTPKSGLTADWNRSRKKTSSCPECLITDHSLNQLAQDRNASNWPTAIFTFWTQVKILQKQPTVFTQFWQIALLERNLGLLLNLCWELQTIIKAENHKGEWTAAGRKCMNTKRSEGSPLPEPTSCCCSSERRLQRQKKF